MSGCMCDLCTNSVDFEEEKCKRCDTPQDECVCNLCEYCCEHEDDCVCNFCEHCGENEEYDCECEYELDE